VVARIEEADADQEGTIMRAWAQRIWLLLLIGAVIAGCQTERARDIPAVGSGFTQADANCLRWILQTDHRRLWLIKQQAAQLKELQRSATADLMRGKSMGLSDGGPTPDAQATPAPADKRQKYNTLLQSFSSEWQGLLASVRSSPPPSDCQQITADYSKLLDYYRQDADRNRQAIQAGQMMRDGGEAERQEADLVSAVNNDFLQITQRTGGPIPPDLATFHLPDLPTH